MPGPGTVWHVGEDPARMTPLVMPARVPLPVEEGRGAIGLTRFRDGLDLGVLDAETGGSPILASGDVPAMVSCQILLEGSAELEWEGLRDPQRLRFGQTSLNLVRAGNARTTVAPRGRTLMVSCSFDPRWFREAHSLPSSFGDAIIRAAEGRTFEARAVTLQSDDRLVRIARELMTNPYRGAAAHLYAESRLLELVAVLMAGWDEGPAGVDGLSRREVNRIFEARDRLMTDLADPPTLRELCQAVGLNRNKLCRGFKALFGATPFQVLRNARLDHARFLIEEERIPIEEVAERAGFASVSSFSHVFRARFGMPPGRWRKR